MRAGAVALALLWPLDGLGAVAELVLLDGTEIRGIEVELRDGHLVLRTEAGDLVPIPLQLVREVRITEGHEPPRVGLSVKKPKVLAGSPAAVRPLPPSEALAAFGREPSRFPRSVLDPVWRPVSVYDPETDVTEFNPARWATSIVDPTWRPRSAFTRDFTEFNPARWARPVLRAEWHPRSGWSQRPWFSPVASAP